jgi:hypothetical protein
MQINQKILTVNQTDLFVIWQDMTNICRARQTPPPLYIKLSVSCKTTRKIVIFIEKYLDD